MKRRARWIGFGLGLIYGFAFRLVVTNEADPPQAFLRVVTFSFLFLVPFGIGFLASWPLKSARWPHRVFAPWIPALLLLVVVAVIGWEGAICVVMASPVVLVMASLGGVAAGLRPSGRPSVAVCVALLPVAVAPIENRLEPPTTTERVATRIEIDASSEVVWRHVASVSEISPEENRRGFFQRIGFPRPLSATLSRPGVGGIRTATFEGGIVFTETVTDWQPGRKLSFTIEPNTESVPATTLDSHLVIGGRFFDVLRGTFEIEENDDGGSTLHLESESRVTTPFNFYSTLWSNAVMHSIQTNILTVIKTRSESAAQG